MIRMRQASLDELRDRIPFASNHLAVHEALSCFAHSQGFDWFTFAVLNPADTRGISNYHEEWKRYYLKKRFYLIDPVVMQAMTAPTAFIWSQQTDSRSYTQQQSKFMREAASFGIRSGLSVPIEGGFGIRAIFTLASSRNTLDDDILEKPLPLLSAAAFLHAHLLRGEGFLSNAPDCPLTIDQLVTLSWLAQGKTSLDVSQIRAVSSRTVEYQLHSIRKKLSANTTAQAVAIAVERRWISV